MGPINVNCTETIFQQMTSAHHFINISHNILNLWIRLIFPETRHPRLQFEHLEWGNSDKNWVRYDFSKLTLYAVTAAMGKPNFACFSLSPIFPFNAPDFPKG